MEGLQRRPRTWHDGRPPRPGAQAGRGRRRRPGRRLAVGAGCGRRGVGGGGQRRRRPARTGTVGTPPVVDDPPSRPRPPSGGPSTGTTCRSTSRPTGRWGTAPIEPGRRSTCCARPGRWSRRRRDYVTTPYVGRPSSYSDTVRRRRPDGPQAPYVWLDADVEPGDVEFGGGYTQETVERQRLAAHRGHRRPRCAGRSWRRRPAARRASRLDAAPTVDSMLTEGLRARARAGLRLSPGQGAASYDLVYATTLGATRRRPTTRRSTTAASRARRTSATTARRAGARHGHRRATRTARPVRGHPGDGRRPVAAGEVSRARRAW